MLVINVVVISSSSSSTCENYIHFSDINQQEERGWQEGNVAQEWNAAVISGRTFFGNSLKSSNIKVDMKFLNLFGSAINLIMQACVQGVM